MDRSREPENGCSGSVERQHNQLGGGLPPGFGATDKKRVDGGQLGGTGLQCLKCKELAKVAKDCPNK